jgi:hypothetical protein
MFNPNYPVQVEGWRGALRQMPILDEENAVKELIESAHQSYPAPVPVHVSEPYEDLT